jgi:hypothetical protein
MSTGRLGDVTLSITIPPDVDLLLRRSVFETRRTKKDLVADAIRAAYGPGRDQDAES